MKRLGLLTLVMFLAACGAPPATVEVAPAPTEIILTTDQVKLMLKDFQIMQTINANPSVQSYLTPEQITTISQMSITIPDMIETLGVMEYPVQLIQTKASS